jgi:hypothetical protein
MHIGTGKANGRGPLIRQLHASVHVVTNDVRQVTTTSMNQTDQHKAQNVRVTKASNRTTAASNTKATYSASVHQKCI